MSYPPIDPNVLEYITGRALDTYEVTRRCSTFVQALLQHTLATLQNDFASTSDFLSLCRSFRDKMQEGMQWGCHGAYRAKFYQEVLCLSDHLFRVRTYRISKSRIIADYPCSAVTKTKHHISLMHAMPCYDFCTGLSRARGLSIRVRLLIFMYCQRNTNF